MNKTAFSLQKRMFFINFKLVTEGKKSDKSLPNTP